MTNSKTVPIHDEGRSYIWIIASAKVVDLEGKLVATECYNFQTAKAKVRRSNRPGQY